GEMITLFGTGFGTQPAVNFNGISAPILFASGSQINTVVPFEISAPVTFVSVDAGSQSFGPLKLPVADAVPALFTVDMNGTGQAAVLNQDGSPNAPTNPAGRGSAISIYMTGAGRFTPSIKDGASGPLTPPFPMPVSAVSVAIGGVPAPLLFAGQAPTLI